MVERNPHSLRDDINDAMMQWRRRMTNETILPELIGKLAELPEHIQKTIRAYGRACGAVCYRQALESEQVQAWKRDSARLDWLADPENTIGNVLLPRDIVERNLGSLRDGIDDAMENKK